MEKTNEKNYMTEDELDAEIMGSARNIPAEEFETLSEETVINRIKNDAFLNAVKNAFNECLDENLKNGIVHKPTAIKKAVADVLNRKYDGIVRCFNRIPSDYMREVYKVSKEFVEEPNRDVAFLKYLFHYPAKFEYTEKEEPDSGVFNMDDNRRNRLFSFTKDELNEVTRRFRDDNKLVELCIAEDYDFSYATADLFLQYILHCLSVYCSVHSISDDKFVGNYMIKATPRYDILCNEVYLAVSTVEGYRSYES